MRRWGADAGPLLQKVHASKVLDHHHDQRRTSDRHPEGQTEPPQAPPLYRDRGPPLPSSIGLPPTNRPSADWLPPKGRVIQTEGTVARLITAENMLVPLVGIVPGLVFGFLIAQQFMAAYDTDQFTFTLSMRWTTLVLSALFIVMVTFVSQWPGLRAIRRLDIAKIVRERAV